MNVLVVTSEPVTAKQIRAALGWSPADQAMHVMVVAPALHDSPLKFWLSDADDAIDRAEAARAETLENLDAAAVPAASDTGDADPTDAIEDMLRTYPAERVLVFLHAGQDRRYREGVDADELQSRFGLPFVVERVASA
jgi:hypothetical protein